MTLEAKVRKHGLHRDGTVRYSIEIKREDIIKNDWLKEGVKVLVMEK